MFYWYINESAMILGIAACSVIALLGTMIVLVIAYYIKEDKNREDKNLSNGIRTNNDKITYDEKSTDTLQIQENRLKIIDIIIKIIDILIKIFKH